MDNHYIFVTAKERREHCITGWVLCAAFAIFDLWMYYYSDYSITLLIVLIVVTVFIYVMMLMRGKYFKFQFGKYTYNFNSVSNIFGADNFNFFPNLFGAETRTIQYEDPFYISILTMRILIGSHGETIPKEFIVIWKTDAKPPDYECIAADAVRKYQIIVLPLNKEIPGILHKSLGVDSIPRYPDKKLYCHAQKYDVLYDENGEFCFREFDGG